MGCWVVRLCGLWLVGLWLWVGCGLVVGFGLGCGLLGCGWLGCGLWVGGLLGWLGWWVGCGCWFKAGLERVYRSSNSQASPVTTAYRRPICLYRDSPEGRKSRTLQEGYYDDISFV